MRWVEMVFPEKENEDPEDDSPQRQSYTLKVIEKPTNDFVRLIKDPLNLISVMGPARSGKSTLMNLLAGCKKTELFATYPGSETFTKGIFVPTRVLTLPKFSSLEDEPVVEASESKNIQVTFVDTEGQGALGDSYDMNLFSPALLTSRVVIYNRTGGLLIEEILSQLGMMVLAAQRLRVEKKGNDTMANSAQSSRPTFGHLFILFNQFRTTEKDTPQYLQSKLLTPEKETDENSENRNQVRELLGSVFE